MRDCPPREQLQRLASGSRTGSTNRHLEDHVETCPACQEFLEALREGDGPAALDSAPGPEAPPILPGIDLREKLGRGGMGVVYKARQERPDRWVAVKVLLAGDYADAPQRDRLRGEAEAVARLQHPNIVQIHEVGEVDGQPFLVLEFAEGGSLARRLDGSPVPAQMAAQLTETLARALHYVHGQGIIHRDLKPANILLFGPPGAALDASLLKIADFGLAKQAGSPGNTQSGIILGTPSYMAPEQALGLAADPRTDVYALGAVCYHLLTGRPPFQAATPGETLEQVRDAEPVPPRRLQPRVARDLETICLKCLRKEPARRYATAREVADDLRRFLDGRAILARPVSAVEHSWRWCRRRPVVASLTALLLLTVGGGVCGVVSQWRRAEEARREALASNEEYQELVGELVQLNPLGLFPGGYEARQATNAVLLKAETHCEHLLQKNPNDLRTRIALTKVRGSLSMLYCLHGNMAETDACLHNARLLWEPRGAKTCRDVECQDWLAIVLTWQAQAFGLQGHSSRALESILQADALRREQLEEQPGSTYLLEKLLECRSIMFGLIHTSREEAVRPLEDSRRLLVELARAQPENAIALQRLALVYLLLGELHSRGDSAQEAFTCWRAAYGRYGNIARAPGGSFVEKFSLALCCSQLMGVEPTDPYYLEAVQLLEQVGDGLERLVERRPQSRLLRATLVDTYHRLAMCHLKTGRAVLTGKTCQRVLALVKALANEPRTDLRDEVHYLETLIAVGSGLRFAKEAAAGKLMAREAESLSLKYGGLPTPDLVLREELALASISLAALFCQLGDPAASLRQAEQARRICEELRRELPDQLQLANSLASAWERIAKARWDLKQTDDALAAFREAVAVQRQVFEQAPGIYANRSQLSRRYGKLAYWGGLKGDWAQVAATLLEREKLWPGNAGELLEVSRDFQRLAERLGKGREHLTPAERTERQHYLDESDRVARKADSLARAGR